MLLAGWLSLRSSIIMLRASMMESSRDSRPAFVHALTSHDCVTSSIHASGGRLHCGGRLWWPCTIRYVLSLSIPIWVLAWMCLTYFTYFLPFFDNVIPLRRRNSLDSRVLTICAIFMRANLRLARLHPSV